MSRFDYIHGQIDAVRERIACAKVSVGPETILDLYNLLDKTAEISGGLMIEIKAAREEIISLKNKASIGRIE